MKKLDYEETSESFLYGLIDKGQKGIPISGLILSVKSMNFRNSFKEENRQGRFYCKFRMIVL